MSKKAWCKYVRDLCGLSQSDLADAVGVNLQTVKRWERRSTLWEPTDAAMSWLSSAAEAHEKDVREMVDKVVSTVGAADTALLPWYPDQETCDADDQHVPFGYRNAVTRSAAEQLARLGVNVVIVYPDEEVPGARTVV